MSLIEYSSKEQLNTLFKDCLQKKLNNPDLIIGTFDNCREYGYTYTLKDIDCTFCIYEHRNSDIIVINGCENHLIKPYGPYVSDTSKWQFLAWFSAFHIEEAVDKLIEFLNLAKVDGIDFGYYRDTL